MANLNDVKSKNVSITLTDGVERTLRYDLNAMAELEERYGSVDNAFKALDEGSIKAVRCILWAGLIHEDESLTEKQVGSLLDISLLVDITNSVSAALDGDLPSEESNGEESPN